MGDGDLLYQLKFLLYVLLLFGTYTQWIHAWQFVLRPLFRVWINVLMLKQLRLSLGKMLEVYIATEFGHWFYQFASLLKSYVKKVIKFCASLQCRRSLRARECFSRKSTTLKLEKRWENGANQKERGRGDEREEKNACPKSLLKWETAPNWSRLTAVPKMSSRPINNEELLRRKQPSLPIK